MAKAPRELPISLIRKALLVALIGFLGSVVALYVLGRMGRPDAVQTGRSNLLDNALIFSCLERVSTTRSAAAAEKSFTSKRNASCR